jgi:hypothetical protein
MQGWYKRSEEIPPSQSSHFYSEVINVLRVEQLCVKWLKRGEDSSGLLDEWYRGWIEWRDGTDGWTQWIIGEKAGGSEEDYDEADE